VLAAAEAAHDAKRLADGVGSDDRMHPVSLADPAVIFQRFAGPPHARRHRVISPCERRRGNAWSNIGAGGSMNAATKSLLFWLMFLAVGVIVWLASARLQGAAQTTGGKPYAVEYYYKVKWGHFDEFKTLYIKNHYPILVREQKMGRILSMNAAFPVYHAGENARWDMRFTIVWKDAATANDDFDSSVIAKELYPNQATFKAEEQRRFELLLEHMDVPVTIDNLSTWSQSPR
jgi:hypothetical protein